MVIKITNENLISESSELNMGYSRLEGNVNVTLTSINNLYNHNRHSYSHNHLTMPGSLMTPSAATRPRNANKKPNKGFQVGQITVGFLFVPHLF